MSLFEYDEEKHMKTVRDESYAEGIAEGKIKGEAETLVKLIDTSCANPSLNWTPEIACEKLGVDMDKYLEAKKYLESLKQD